MITTNLALRFLLELSGMAAVGHAGFHATHGPARWVLAIAAPVALAVFWALVVAPKATNVLTPSTREIIGSLALVCAAGALALTGHPRLALVFGALVVLNQVLLAVLPEGALSPELAR